MSRRLRLLTVANFLLSLGLGVAMLLILVRSHSRDAGTWAISVLAAVLWFGLAATALVRLVRSRG